MQPRSLAAPAKEIRVLLIEDNRADAELLGRELVRSGFSPSVRRIETAEEMAAALDSEAFDLVLCEFGLPRFSAAEALEVCHSRELDLPFIVCSSTVEEREAIGLLKAGAMDFFLKDNLVRLGAAVERELRDAEHRRLRRDAEAQNRDAVRAIAESEERFRSIVEGSPNAVLLADAEGRLVQVNREAETLFGYARKELVGRPLELLLPGALQELGGRELLRARRARSQRRSARKEAEGQRKDGARFPVDLGLTTFRSARGPMLLAIASDSRERRSLELRLRQAQKLEAIGRLAGGVAHDFNNLLGVIIGYGQMLRQRLGPEHEALGDLEELLGAADRAAALTRQLLAFGRRQHLKPTLLDLNEIVRGLEKLLRRVLPENIEIDTRLDGELGTVEADPTQLEQVVMNLASNAKDAMPGGGQLMLKTANVDLTEEYVSQHAAGRVGAYVMLAVSDTGEGMDAATRSHIFEPFFSTKPDGEGTGLGLATVYGIVKQSGGFVWVYSEPGQGATFKIYLPRVDGAPSETASEAPPLRGVGGEETILVVEDQEALRRMIVRMLEREGYTVLAATDGTEALKAAEEHPQAIHLLLTDLVLPRMGGAELARLLREQRAAIRVLYMSGYTNETIVARGLLSEDVALLEKPFSLAALSSAVRKALDRDR